MEIKFIFFQSICLILHARSLFRVKQKHDIENKTMLFTVYRIGLCKCVNQKGLSYRIIPEGVQIIADRFCTVSKSYPLLCSVNIV